MEEPALPIKKSFRVLEYNIQTVNKNKMGSPLPASNKFLDSSQFSANLPLAKLTEIPGIFPDEIGNPNQKPIRQNETKRNEDRSVSVHRVDMS